VTESVWFGDGHQGLRAGKQRDCRGVPHFFCNVGGESDGVDGTLRGPPA
jgi:hypothetical protein